MRYRVKLRLAQLAMAVFAAAALLLVLLVCLGG